MAGDWIKMGKDLLTHPKVVRMSSALNADRLRTVGGLFAVWCLFDTHSVDGQLSGYTAEIIDDEIRLPGFSSAMESVGWLEFGEDGASLPDFEEHNGQSAKRRAQETERKRNERKTSALDADKKRTREEKRREDIPPPPQRAHEPSIEVMPMEPGWQPSPQFATLAKLSGLPPTPSPEGLGEFVAYWLTQPTTMRTQLEWDNALVKSMKHERVKGSGRPFERSATAARTPNHGGHDVIEPA